MRKTKFISWLTLAALIVTTLFQGISVQAETEVVSIIEDSDTTTSGELFKVQYFGTWYEETGHSDLFSNGDDHYAHDKGTYYEMRFVGHKFEIIASLNQNHGIYDVYIDGELAGNADSTTTGATIHQQVIFTSEDLEEGEHTLKVVFPESNYMAIQLDAIKVYHEAITPTGLTLSDTEMRLEHGVQKQIRANVFPAYATNAVIEWESGDESVATVSKDGIVTAVSEQEAETIITATVAGTQLQAEVKVTVVPTIEYLSASVGSTDRLETQDDYAELKSLYKGSWNDVAWKGDVLNSKIVVCSRGNEVHNVEVMASDFVGESGVITADNVEVKWLKEVQANIGRGNPYAPVKDFPDVIYKGGKLDIQAEKVMFSWITINVPKDAKPGTYTGAVTVTADELEAPYVFDYTFEVLDLVQPETSETDTQIQIWQHPFSVANYYGVAEEDYFTEEHFKYMRASMKEYQELGGKDVVANIVEEAWNHQSYYSDPSMVKWTKNSDGTFTFDYTWYDAWINFQIECGVLDPENGVGQIKCYSIVPWNNQIAWYDEALQTTVTQSYTPGAADWKEIWTTFLTDFMKHSKEMGWFDMTYISMDERSMDQLEPAVELLDSIADENGVNFKISSAFNYSNEADYSFTDKIDDISINLAYVSNTSEKMRDMAEHRRELGLYTTIYTCTGNYPGNFTISDPADNNWVMWYSLAHDTDGFMRWAWDNWVEDPLTDVTYKWWEPGDGWFIYPAEKDVTENVDYYYSTPRYEMLKKGVRDINKAKYLMENSEELSGEVKALVSSLQQPATGNSYGSVVPASEADRELVFSETARMRDGIIELSRKYIEENKESEPVQNPFKDVYETDYYYDEVLWAYNKGITAGKGAALFGPGDISTRGDVVTFLWRAAGSPEPRTTECPFEDIIGYEYYYKAVLWAVEKGITAGTSKTTFEPNAQCTRAQVVSFLWRADGSPAASTELAFVDVAENTYYRNAVLWAVEKGITAGTSETTFEPDAYCTRGQVVTFLYRYYH